MRVLALGGPGAMGAAAVHTAVTLPDIDEIVIADRDLAAARRLANRLAYAPMPIRAIEVDVTDDERLRRALSAADVVLNTVGPYYRFGPAVLRAAITTGTHYLDICDDWEPTERLLELDHEARDQGVCAIIGMGASPGMSNLLAAVAAAELETVRDVYTAWPVDMDAEDKDLLLPPGGTPSAAAVHWMQQSSGTIRVVEAGRLTDRRPLAPTSLRLPGGRRGTAYTVGHPEPITLRHSLKASGDAATLMVVTPWTLAYLEVLRRDIDGGRLTNDTAARALAEPTLSRLLRSVPIALRTKGPGTLPAFFAAVTGSAHGRELTVLACLNMALPATDPARGLLGDMARATGIPLALGMSQLADGSALRPGVHPPETAIDPVRFFSDLDRVLGRDSDTPLYRIEREAG
ncbi:Saccharopine dehydrogenase [Nocardia otitidiscaviarum]|uniref:Saccharopine dehydrogenase n=1 Tax=Nocardia otitidiscaviarum TaxID=1823 RepID=A0A378YM40_9NOCA|nr:saccharopine dehydrogenase NADP-binding domain-containing protein [Nocardia otitidiscaviarum]SUA78226.1 Saccharopine dehydrogenase [Nocardia otitidiscaviarum]